MSFVTDALGITGQDEPDYSKMEFTPYSISGATGGVNWNGKSGTVKVQIFVDGVMVKEMEAEGAGKQVAVQI